MFEKGFSLTAILSIGGRRTGGRGDVGVATGRGISKFACRRTQIFLKKVAKAAELIFAGAVDLKKMCVEVRRLTLLCCREKKFKKVFLTSFQT